MRLQMKNFQKTVAAAGTRERLTTAALRQPSIVIQALAGNTNAIFLGGSNVSSTQYFVRLAANNSVTLTAAEFGQAGAQIDLNSIWIDVTTNAEGVNVGYMERASGD